MGTGNDAVPGVRPAAPGVEEYKFGGAGGATGRDQEYVLPGLPGRDQDYNLPGSREEEYRLPVGSGYVGDGHGTYFHSYTPPPHGKTVTEKLCIDKEAGIFSYSRSSEAKGHQEMEMGAAWFTANVAGARFVTRTGDPSLEFSHPSADVVRAPSTLEYVNMLFTNMKHAAMMAVNPLNLTFALSVVMAICLWRVFPRQNDKYNMSDSANEDMLHWASVFAILTLLSGLLSGWWLGVFRFGFLAQDTALQGKVSRLQPSISCRFEPQRNVNMGLLVCVLIWCVGAVIMWPILIAINSGEDCPAVSATSTAGSGGRLLHGASDEEVVPAWRSLSTTATSSSCYKMDGVDRTCGVGDCDCGASASLMCNAPPPLPGPAGCIPKRKPLCSVSGDVEASGVHIPLLVLAIGTSIFAGILFFCCLMNIAGMVSGWFMVSEAPAADTSMVPPLSIPYHCITVSFRSKELPFTFTLPAHEDAQTICKALMPDRPAPTAQALLEQQRQQAQALASAPKDVNVISYDADYEESPGPLASSGAAGGEELVWADDDPLERTRASVTTVVAEEELEPMWC